MTRAETIKYMIGFSILTGFTLAASFGPFARTGTVSAAAVEPVVTAVAQRPTRPAAAKVAAPANAASTANTANTIQIADSTGSTGLTGFTGTHGNHGGHDRPDRVTPESSEVQNQVSELRHATARFHDIAVAIKEGYAPFGACFSDPVEGNMGYHYANAELMEDPLVDPNHPELLLYEKQEDGSMRFVGVEYLAFQAAWHKAGNRYKPRLFGETFHLNSTLLDEPFYLLHVWQWKHNPSGRFEDWNPRVVCR